MEIEEELAQIKDRITNIEDQIARLQYKQPASRPNWIILTISFVVVFILVMISIGIISLIAV